MLMGHDISAYLPNNEATPVAEMRRESMDNKKQEIYFALNSIGSFRTASGNGDKKCFSKTELEEAYKYLSEQYKVETEINFIQQCLNNVDENGKILIHFS